MGKLFRANIDLEQNEIQNSCLHSVTGTPANVRPGQFWFDPVAGKFMFRGTTTSVDPTDRAEHHGTLDVANVTGLDAVIRAVPLNEFAAPIAPVDFGGKELTHVGTPLAVDSAVPYEMFSTAAARTLDQIPTAAADVTLGTHKLTEVSDGTGPQDVIVLHQLEDEAALLRSEMSAAVAGASRTLDQVPTAVATVDLGGQTITNLGAPQTDSDAINRGYAKGLVAGMDWKPNIRAVADVDIALTGLQTAGGVDLADGDRALAAAQVDQLARLIYVVRAGAWEVAEDSTDGELTAGATVNATEGANKGMWRLMTPDPIAVGTTLLTWEKIPATDYTSSNGVKIIGGDIQADYTIMVRKLEALLGDGVATEFTIPHSYGFGITADLWDVTTGQQLEAEIFNDPVAGAFATVKVAAAPAAGAYRFVVHG